MCGICGFTGEVDNRSKVLEMMTNLMIHRGPDSSGFFADNNISMGFRRLSIIDLDGGEQPIYNEDNNLVLTFNGEIYNYKEIKQDLMSSGHKFYTNTDSEVLIHAFEQWGEQMLNKLRGMFAFAIWNRKDNSLFMARDFFGIKPLHYAKVGKHFVYASEIKSILMFPGYIKKFNYKALDNYLSFQYCVPPETFFKGIYCLLPGHYLRYKDGNLKIERYFNPKFEQNENISLDEAVQQIEEAFEDSVNVHKISDVDVGCFLSSGVDSSYVASYFEGQKTFTVGFDLGEKYNEIGWARKVSREIGAKHYCKIITAKEFWNAVDMVQYYMDQPLADPSCVALYFVAKLASTHVKVVLSGEGADEFFGGYNIYQEPGALSLYKKLVPNFIRKLLAKIVKAVPKSFRGKSYIIRGATPIEQRFIGNAFMFSYEDKLKILKNPSLASRPQDICQKFYKDAREYDDVTKMQYLDINLWMTGDILLKADRMSMANSLELRVPFLDKEVFDVASRLPTSLKVTKSATKYALRLAARKHLPESTAQKRKLGFPVPIRVWLQSKRYYEIVKKAFLSETANEFFNSQVLLEMLDEHFKRKCDNSRKIWTIYTFIVWYDIYFPKVHSD